MSFRTLRVLLVVVVLLATVPHLPTWYPVARDAIRGIDGSSVFPAIVSAAHLAGDWLALHRLLAEVAGGMVAGIVIVVGVARLRSRRPKPAQSDIWIMPRSITIEPTPVVAADPTVVPITSSTAGPEVVPIAAEARAARRQPGVLQPFERESRRSMVRDLFDKGRSIAEIARTTGIGQDAIRTTVRERQSA